MVALLVLLLFQLAYGCTHFRIIAKDKSVIIGRSMEFDVFLEEYFQSDPKGTQYKMYLPQELCQGKEGVWESKYDILNAFAQGGGAGGMNSQGLSVEALYLQEAVYENLTKSDCLHSISQGQLPNYILGNFKTVEEVVTAFDKNVFPKVWGASYLDIIPPLHWAISDATGRGIVLEYTGDGPKIHDNWLGVVTNFPTYDWHMSNLQNYANLQRTDITRFRMGGRYIMTGGTGFGTLGIPGDPTSPSRFIRAAFMKEFAQEVQTADDGVNLAFHILNTVDRPVGVTMDVKGTMAEYTQNIYVQDLTNKRIFFRGYNDLSIRYIDLTKLSFDQSRFISIDRKFINGVVDSTEDMKPVPHFKLKNSIVP